MKRFCSFKSYNLTLISLILFNQPIWATSISIAPSAKSLLFEESLTARSETSESLFYNPAAIANNSWNVNLINAEVSADQESLEYIKKISEENENIIEQQLKEIKDFSGVRKGNINVAALDVKMPYVALRSFANVNSDSSIEPTKLNSDLNSSVGGIFGIGVSYKRFSLGASLYVINQMNVRLNPEGADWENIKNTNDLEAELKLNSSNYTKAYYGQGVGKNFGVLYKFLNDNDSAIGLSVLNAGKTKFYSNSSYSTTWMRDAESNFYTETKKYGISLQTPLELPELKNIGIYLTSPNDQIHYYALSIDYQDFDGNYIKNKATSSISWGFKLPTKIAFLTSMYLQEKSNKENENPKNIKGKNQEAGIHLGFLQFALHGGYRANQSASTGIEMKLHAGVDKKISFLEVNLLASKSRSLEKDTKQPEIVGTAIGLKAIFMIP